MAHQIVTTWHTGDMCQDVVGESHCAHDLWRIASTFGGAERTVQVNAVLVPEPTNEYDDCAVMVTIQGFKVGYLPSEDAGEYFPILLPLANSGRLLGVPARLWWGADGSGEFIASVSLDLPGATMLFMANPVPSSPAMLLPGVKKVPVADVDAHIDVLAPRVRGRGEAVVWVTLHEITVTKGRIEKPFVEVRCDRQPVGVIGGVWATGLLPLIRRADERGVTLYTRAELAGNTLDVKVGVMAIKSHEVDDAWLAELDAMAGTAHQSPPAYSQAPPPIAPPGWYPDPVGTGHTRYWDGHLWTPQVR